MKISDPTEEWLTASQLTPGRYVQRWAGYDVTVEIFWRRSDGALVARFPTGMCQDIASAGRETLWRRIA